MVRGNLFGYVGDRLCEARHELFGELVGMGNEGSLDLHIRKAIESRGDTCLGYRFGPKADARRIRSDFRDSHKPQIFDEVSQKIEVGK
jgi:hypothetical protein